MTSRKLTVPEMAEYGFTHAVRIRYTDLNNTSPPGLTRTLAIYPESGTAGQGTYFRQPVALAIPSGFVGGAISAITVQIGVAIDPDQLMVATNIFEHVPERFPIDSVGTLPFSFQTADTLIATFTAVGANLNALLQGDLEIFFTVADFRKLDAYGFPPMD